MDCSHSPVCLPSIIVLTRFDHVESELRAQGVKRSRDYEVSMKSVHLVSDPAIVAPRPLPVSSGLPSYPRDVLCLKEGVRGMASVATVVKHIGNGVDVFRRFFLFLCDSENGSPR